MLNVNMPLSSHVPEKQQLPSLTQPRTVGCSVPYIQWTAQTASECPSSSPQETHTGRKKSLTGFSSGRK